MLPLDEYQQLIKTRDRLRRQKDQSQGAYDQILLRLKKETDCDTKEDLEKLLAKLKKQIEFKLPAFQKAKEDFWNKWEDKLGSL